MDIKTIGAIVALLFTVGGLFIQIGEILNRLEVVESVSAPDISPIKDDIANIKKEMAVLENDVKRLKNPLGN
jgi:hypothetical protein